MVDAKKIKDINYSLQKMYEDIHAGKIRTSPEEYIIKKFDSLFLFEIFFRTYMSDNKDSEIPAKYMLAEEIVDTLLYNGGDITIEELQKILNVKKKVFSVVDSKEFTIEEMKEDSIFDVRVNGREMELDSNFYENLQKLSIDNKPKRTIIVKEESNGRKNKKEKGNGFFNKRNN